MKLLVNRDDALKVIARAAQVSARKTTHLILTMVLLEADGEVLRVSGTDLDRMMTGECPAKVSEPGAIAVTAASLNEFISALPAGGEVLLEHGKDDPRLIARCGRASVRIPVLPAADYPNFEALPATAASGLVEPKALAYLLSKVDHAMSREQTRYWLCGIYLHPVTSQAEPTLRAIATDGHQLGWADIPCPKGLEEMPATILPRETAVEWTRLLADQTADVEIAATATLIRLDVAGGSLTSKLVDGSYPDYVRAVPTSQPNSIRADKATLEAALKRIRVVQETRTSPVKLEASAGRLKVSAHSFNAGQAEDEIEVECEAEASFGFQGQYLANVLAQTAGDQVEIRFTDANDAFTFRDPADDRALQVIMPVRV